MKNINANLLLEEAKRLADAEIVLLNSMLKTDGQLPEKTFDDQQKSLLKREEIDQYIQVLKEAKLKLDDSKMVIAVVGTMKAGKSTTINAIVGSEVLPNRNLPMTALPTAICHTPDQIDPILNFENIQPINDLIEQIRSVTINKNLDNEDDDIQNLLLWIKKGNICQKKYKGTEEIFVFLKRANDIVRLSKILNLKFPYEKYKQINEFPCIEIEFSHLEKKDNHKGKLILLDTPGPNEFGQSQELRKMLQEQLQRANAILAVLDYTQLKSEADAEVRDFLKKVSEKSDKIYAIVNKFDQKNDHGLDKEKVRDIVTNNLMKDLIKSKDQVFPVSSLNAFIANRARSEILRNNQLPDPTKQSWVKTFGEKAFGMAYEEQIKDNDSVLKYADKIWEDSYFSEPIEKVLEKAHQEALSILMSSFIKNLDKISQHSVSHGQSLLTGLSKVTTQKEKEAETLNRTILDIKQLTSKSKNNITQFQLIKKRSAEDLNKHIDEIKSCISTIFLQDSAKMLSKKFKSQSSIISALTTLQKELESYLSSAQEVVLENLTKTQGEIKIQLEEIKKTKVDLVSKGVEVNEFNLSSDHFQISDLITKDEISIIGQNINKKFSSKIEITNGMKEFYGYLPNGMDSFFERLYKKEITYYHADIEETKKDYLNSVNKVFYEASVKLKNQLEKIEKPNLLAIKEIEERTREQERKATKIHSEASKTKQEELKTKEILKGFQKIRLDLDLLSKEI